MNDPRAELRRMAAEMRTGSDAAATARRARALLAGAAGREARARFRARERELAAQEGARFERGAEGWSVPASNVLRGALKAARKLLADADREAEAVRADRDLRPDAVSRRVDAIAAAYREKASDAIASAQADARVWVTRRRAAVEAQLGRPRTEPSVAERQLAATNLGNVLLASRRDPKSMRELAARLTDEAHPAAPDLLDLIASTDADVGLLDGLAARVRAAQEPAAVRALEADPERFALGVELALLADADLRVGLAADLIGKGALTEAERVVGQLTSGEGLDLGAPDTSA